VTDHHNRRMAQEGPQFPMNKEEIDNEKRKLVAAKNFLSKKEAKVKLIGFKLAQASGRGDQGEIDRLSIELSDAIDEKDDAQDIVDSIKQRIKDLKTERVADNGSTTTEARQFQQGSQIPFPDGTSMESNSPATPNNPAEDEKLRQKLAERQAILEQRQKELAIRNNPAPTIPPPTVVQEIPASNTLYPSMTPGAKELPPLVRLDQQPLKLSEKMYPVMAYKENVYEAWPEEAIAVAAKRYPELPRQIEESRQLVPDHPDDLLDPDYFEEPENPTFKDLYRASVWKQKKHGKL
jgi:hypothetical protein